MMNYQTFDSLYGFSLGYPKDWNRWFGLEHVILAPANDLDIPFRIRVSTVQTVASTIETITKRVRDQVLHMPDATILGEQRTTFSDRKGYRCVVRYHQLGDVPDQPQVLKQALVIGIPLHRGNLGLFVMFVGDADQFADLTERYIDPVLSTFKIDPAQALPLEGYRRIARDQHQVAVDVPRDWLCTGLDEQRVAFRSPDQSWQVDNITLVTAPSESVHPLSDYYKLARSSFQSNAHIKVLDEQQSTLGGLPAYDIHYTVPDKMNIVNRGRQVIAVTSGGTLVNLTLLAPQARMSEYEPIFEQVYASVSIHP